MTTPSAKVIADSINPNGDRLTTLEVTMHRFVLAEFNTHRVFSRNSASSRAIPVRKQLERVKHDPAFPVVWTAEQPGMQGGEELVTHMMTREWEHAARDAAEHVEHLVALGVHKSIANRLLEPFMWHTVIVSSTTWTNFFAQRCSPLAQPEIRVVAEAMESELQAHSPVEKDYGEWHLPYIDPGEFDTIQTAMQVSVARCARVSYLTHDGKRDPDADKKLFEKLISATPPHASPLEHVATPLRPSVFPVGNFHGWRQLRHEIFS